MFGRKKYLTGLVAPDYIDPRDYQLAELQPQSVSLPGAYDLRENMGPIGSQNYGSCTSWAATALSEYWNRKEYHKIINLSEKFVYHNTKRLSGLFSIQGDYLINAIKAICKYGAPLLVDYPDAREKNWDTYVKKEPKAAIYKKAEKYKGKTYWVVKNDLEDVRQAIYQNKCPVATGMMWRGSYSSIDKSGRLPLPSGKEVGGHAIACVGWDQERIWFKNSWGERHGANGYFYIPFGEFKKHTFWNFRVMLDMEAPDTKMQGWVAERHIKHVNEPKFKTGDKIVPETGLRLRSSPTIYASIVKRLTSNMSGEIISDERKEANGYFWRRVTINS